MTKVLVHELATHAQPLLDRLRAALAAHGSEEAQRLAVRAHIEDRAKPCMVLTGQFSSGKSTLIKALTDGAVEPKIDADIATDEVTEYPWDGEVILVDTPGVQSGVRHHDELALEAIGNSDFILFVITVGLFDDASAKYLRYLAHERRQFDQMIVVITQTSKQSAPAGIRKEAVRHALGTVSDVLPVCEVDSLYYLRSLEDDRHRDALRSKSGMDALRSRINQISEKRGDLAQLRQPYQLIRQLCDEAYELFVTDPNEKLALSVLASQRKVITERRALIETQFVAAESRFKSNCLADVVAFVDTAINLPPDNAEQRLAEAEERLVEALERHAEKFAAEVNILTAQQFDTLAAQIGEIGDSNRAAKLLRYTGGVQPPTPDRIDTSGGSTATQATGTARGQFDWLGDMSKWLKQAQTTWGAGDGVKAASGTFGHQVVKEVGHLFGAKFKPWQAVKIANVIGKAAKAADFVVTVGLSAYEVFANERDQHRAQIEAERKHSAFVTQIMSHADRIAADARRQLSSIIDPRLNEVLAQIDQLVGEIVDAGETRGAGAKELTEIARAADRMLERSMKPDIIDGRPVSTVNATGN